MKLLLVVLLGVALSHGSATPIISPSLESAFETKSTVDIMIIMKSETVQVLQAIQSQSFVNENQKATILFNELNKFTSESQKEVLAILSTHRSTGVKGFYITNRISVLGATPDIVKALSGRSDIAEIREAKVVHIEKSLEITNAKPQVLEWGVNDINAPKMWAEGFTGKGIVVSSIDTGVRYTHESLISGFRSEYGWFDPYYGTLRPSDTNGHGTHTLATLAGRNGTGIAYESSWMTCLGCGTESCSEQALIACGQFTFCPTLADGSGSDCTKRPRLSSNSWAGGYDETWYNDVVDSWNEVGIIPIFGIGNGGNDGCQSANSPGDQPNLIGVGATDINRDLAYFSSRGPTRIVGRMKPDVSAPGVSVTSAGIDSDTAYATFSGTSMATPHVAGAVALLLQKNPALTRQQITAALQETAVKPLLGTMVLCAGGGFDPNNPWPNNAYGHGKIDVYLAAGKV